MKSKNQITTLENKIGQYLDCIMMPISFLMSLLVVFTSSCQSIHQDIPAYHQRINKAELLICNENYQAALYEYQIAFTLIEKPFGKDLFNAALAADLTGLTLERDEYLRTLVCNSRNLAILQNTFKNADLDQAFWKDLQDSENPGLNQKLYDQLNEVSERDQWFRPDYEHYDDTINAIRKSNLTQILEITDSMGLPSHCELGYSDNLRGQKYHIVLHHTAQRRSYDKSVYDLEPLLRDAVNSGRIDPEIAIYFMNFQSDQEKGPFEVYAASLYQHPLLPDSLNDKTWLPRLSAETRMAADSIRELWHANILEDISRKTRFMSETNYPFIFTSVRKSVFKLDPGLDQEGALEQYRLFTSMVMEIED
jgi:hypothetical protein